MTRLGIVTGLAAEAACVRRAAARLPAHDRPLIFCAGASAARARAGSERLIAEGAEGLISFGIAGALAPGLKPGALVLAESVLAPNGRRSATDGGWRQRLERRAAAAFTMTVAPLLGQDRVVASAAEKSSLFKATKAVAVDMESHGVAAAAEAAGVPLLVLRAVADPARRAIPASASSVLAADGRLRGAALVAPLLSRPWEIIALARLAADGCVAMRSLGRVAALDPARFALA